MSIGLVTAKDGLLLHKGPGKNSLRLELMPYQAKLEIYDEEGRNGWSCVKWNGLRGYAASEYIRVLDPPRKEPPPWWRSIPFGWWIVSVVVFVVVLGVIFL